MPRVPSSPPAPPVPPAPPDPPLRISNDRAELDVALIHRYLAQESYWAQNIALATVETALANSLCFGGYLGARQVAFARVVTDRATFAHLKDVFVLPEFRGKGYGVAIVQAIMDHPDLRRVAMTLGTADAHSLYEKFGFGPHPDPRRPMFRSGTFLDPDEPAAPNAG
jgi:GNAT superfamily N-acetyltransferase